MKKRKNSWKKVLSFGANPHDVGQRKPYMPRDERDDQHYVGEAGTLGDRETLLNQYLDDLDRARKDGDPVNTELAMRRLRELSSALIRDLKTAEFKGPNKSFKPYRTEQGVDVQNRGEFTGDKFPTTGDPAAIEVNHFEGGNELMHRDVKRENDAVDHTSPIMSEEAKRKDIKKHIEINKEHKVPKYAATYYVCPNCGFQGREDEFVKATDLDGNPGLQCPRCDFVFSYQEGDPMSTDPGKKGWRGILGNSLSKKSFDQKDLAFSNIKVVFGAIKSHINRIERIFDKPTERTHDDMPEPIDIFDKESLGYLLEAEQALGDFIARTVGENVGKLMYDFESGRRSSKCEQKVNPNRQEWAIDKVGNFELVGFECKTKAGVEIRQNGKVVKSHQVDRDGHTWRELINQAVHQDHLHKLANQYPGTNT